MLSALVSLPKGISRTQLLEELRQLKVRVIEIPDAGPVPAGISRNNIDFLVIGSNSVPAAELRKFLEPARSRPPVLMVETSGPLHRSPAYDEEMWCVHRPLKPCLIRTYVQFIQIRKRLMERVARLSVSSKDAQQHSVDALWFSVFDRMKRNARK